MSFDLSIILATKNRAGVLDEMLSSLYKAARKISFEVIVIDGNSTDSTLEVLKKYGISKIYNEEEILGPGRHSWPQLYNFGFAAANGKWAMYGSDDIVFEENSLDRGIELLNSLDDTVGGGAFFYKNVIAEEEWKDYGVDLTHGNNVFINYGVVRTDIFRMVGGLDENYNFYCADGDLCLKIINNNYRILPLPYSKVVHNNVLDMKKKENLGKADRDISYYNAKWKGIFNTDPLKAHRISHDVFLNYYEQRLKQPEKKPAVKAEPDSGNKTRLHLGCGLQYFEGYINIDYPQSEHTVQQNARVDLYADITRLNFPADTIDEIRLHHVFEHFDRAHALALLVHWAKWLKIGGILHIETPDVMQSARQLVSGISYGQKQAVMRHVFGSHESDWAYHYDGWYDEKFVNVLGKLGFKVSVRNWSWNEYPNLANVEVLAVKERSMSSEELLRSADEILKDSMVNNVESEQTMCKVWQAKMHDAFKVIEESPVTLPAQKKSINAAVFSKDRAMQLDATLSSFYARCGDSELVSLKVLYTCSSSIFREGYEKLKSKFSRVEFIEQTDFKKDLLNILQGSGYILFLVDDNIFVRDFHIGDSVKFLQGNSDVVGFSLRLGKNTNYCYPLNKSQALPPFVDCGKSLLKYSWENAELDFGYPMEVSSSVYRSGEISDLLSEIEFGNPNEFESLLSRSRTRFGKIHPALGCYSTSVTFCLPLNKVQTTEKNNRAGDKFYYNPLELAEMYNRGSEIDIKRFENFVPSGCHQEEELHFVINSVNNNRPVNISVIIPCYNYAEFLPEAVESVISQTYRDFEIIIVNDGSTDNTAETAENIIARYPDEKIRLISQDNSGSPAVSRNNGIEISKGKYFLCLDADDKISSTFLEKTFAVMEENPGVGFVYSHIQHFGDFNNLYELPEFDADTIIHLDNIVSVGSLVRKTAWEQAGSFNTGEGYEDWDFWVTCIEKGWEGFRIPEPLFYYRKKQSGKLDSDNRQREKFIARIVLNHPELYSRARLEAAEILFNSGTMLPAKKVLIACTHFWPSVGGLESIAGDLGNNLVRLGYSVEVATPGRKDRRSDLHRGMKIISLDSSGAVQNNFPVWALELRNLVTSGNYNSCILLADPLNHVIWSLLNAEIPGNTSLIIQPVINEEGYKKWKDDEGFRKNLVSILKNASLVSMSQDGFETRFFKEESLGYTYIPNAGSSYESKIDFRTKYNIPGNTKIILHVANLWPVKNHPAILKEFKNMPGDWKLVMIGYPSNDLEYVRKVKEEIDNSENVLYIPGLPKSEISGAMEASDFVILGSLAEGAPVMILEAMSHGKPWITTPTCGSISENAGGIITSLDKFTAAIKFMLENDNLRKELSELGRRHWENTYNWDTVIRAWEELILEGKSGSSFETGADISGKMLKIKKAWEEYSGENNENEAALQQSSNNKTDNKPRAAMVEKISGGPLVSVIIPTYNRIEKLSNAVGSVLKQEYENYEIIVVNDAGEDVAGIIKEFNDRRINLITHEDNRGLAAARNTGLAAASGKYIALLDDDDEFYPGHLSTAVKHLDDRNRVVYTDAVRFNYIKEEDEYILQSKTVPYSIDFDRNKLLVGNIAPVNCFVFEKSLLDAVGMFDESLPVLEDWEFWIRLSSVTRFAHVKRNTVLVNWYNDGTTMSSSKGKDFVVTRKLIYQKYESEIKQITNLNEIIAEFNSIWKSDNVSEPTLVSIIALSYNQLEYTKAFVESVLNFTKLPFELILVDNESHKETVRYLSELPSKDERIKVILNDKNLGFPGGVNKGIKAAQGKYILIANNDIVVTDGWLERMVELAETERKIGIVGPISNSVSGVQLDKEAEYSSLDEMHEYASAIKEKNRGKTFSFPRVAFLCTLIKKEVINDLGGLDERFSPGNFEDDDFCLRAQIAGYKTIIAADVFIHHFGSKSFTAEGTEKYAQRLGVNKNIFVKKWGADPEDIWLKGKEYKQRRVHYPLDNDEFSEAVQRAQACISDNEHELAIGYLEFVFENARKASENSDLRLDPLYHLAGRICLIQQKNEDAINYFRKELDYNGAAVRAYKGMADAFAAMGNDKEALKMLEYSRQDNLVTELSEVKYAGN